MQGLLRIKRVLAATGLSRSGLYKKVSDGTFPAPIKIGTRSAAWIEAEVAAWIGERIAQSRPVNHGKSVNRGHSAIL